MLWLLQPPNKSAELQSMFCASIFIKYRDSKPTKTLKSYPISSCTAEEISVAIKRISVLNRPQKKQESTNFEHFKGLDSYYEHYKFDFCLKKKRKAPIGTFLFFFLHLKTTLNQATI